MDESPRQVSSTSGPGLTSCNLQIEALEEFEKKANQLLYIPRPKEAKDVDKLKNELSQLKESCASLHGELNQFWNACETADELALLERFYKTKTVLEAKFLEYFPTTGENNADIDGDEFGTEIFEASSSTPVHDNLPPPLTHDLSDFDIYKPIGRGQRRKQSSQSEQQYPVGGLVNHPNYFPNFQAQFAPLAGPMQAPYMPNISMAFVWNPAYGIPVAFPVQNYPPGQHFASTTAQETRRPVEVIELDSDSESPKEKAARPEPSEIQPSTDESSEANPAPIPNTLEKFVPPIPPPLDLSDFYSVSVDIPDDDNLQSDDHQDIPDTMPSPDQPSPVENSPPAMSYGTPRNYKEWREVNGNHNSAPASTTKQPSPSNKIYSFMQHANDTPQPKTNRSRSYPQPSPSKLSPPPAPRTSLQLPSSTSRHSLLDMLESPTLPSENSPTQKSSGPNTYPKSRISYQEYMRRQSLEKESAGAPGSVKRSLPVKPGVPKKPSSNLTVEAALIGRSKPVQLNGKPCKPGPKVLLSPHTEESLLQRAKSFGKPPTHGSKTALPPAPRGILKKPESCTDISRISKPSIKVSHTAGQTKPSSGKALFTTSPSKPPSSKHSGSKMSFTYSPPKLPQSKPSSNQQVQITPSSPLIYPPSTPTSSTPSPKVPMESMSLSRKTLESLSPKNYPHDAKANLPLGDYRRLHDVQYYYRVTNEDKTKCLICRHNFKFITKHYREKHPTCEVLISRISPQDMQLAVEEAASQIVPPLTGTFQCRLCPVQLQDLQLFQDHITAHTGEYNYCCPRCSFTFAEKISIRSHWASYHAKELGSVPENWKELGCYPKPEKPNKLQGYVCPVCNWLQLSKKRVEKHVENVHGIDILRFNEIKSINMVMHIPAEDESTFDDQAPKKTGRKKKVVDYNEDTEEKASKKKKRKSTDIAFRPEKVPSPVKTYIEHREEDDSVPCLECQEPYNMTTKSSDWIECIICRKWLHVDCTVYSETCLICGNWQKAHSIGV